jgi:hypothetical protein
VSFWLVVCLIIRCVPNVKSISLTASPCLLSSVDATSKVEEDVEAPDDDEWDDDEDDEDEDDEDDDEED